MNNLFLFVYKLKNTNSIMKTIKKLVIEHYILTATAIAVGGITAWIVGGYLQRAFPQINPNMSMNSNTMNLSYDNIIRVD